jgi:hypothetical protein
VRGAITAAGKRQSFTFHFVVGREDPIPHPPSLHPSRYPNQKLHFRSRPDLEPPWPYVSTRSSATSPGYIFTSPYNGAGQAGPMIFDDAGNLIWFLPLSRQGETVAANLQVQQLGGQPVLTWWQGYIPPQGFGIGEMVIANSSYKEIGRVHAGNGYRADLHDFHITPQGTTLLSIFQPIRCDLSSLGGPRGGAVTDSLFQELDLHTGLVRREWHSVDHVALADSYSSAVTTTTDWPFDYLHVNSAEQQPDGSTLVSARNTWALYELNTQTGQITATIGGRHSNYNLQSGARTAYQHDAKELPGGNISIFDNGGVPMVHPQSRVLIEALDQSSRTARVVAQYEHPSRLRAGSQGNAQPLPGGDMFVGWGSKPFFSEFSASGQLLFDAHFAGSYESYRGYRFPWAGSPSEPPKAVASTSGARQTVYVSWNGDTRAASWRLLSGPSAGQLAPVASAARSGFETALQAPAVASFLAVQALDAQGSVIGTSATIKAR